MEEQEFEDFGIKESEEVERHIIHPFHENAGVTRYMNDLQPVDFLELFPQDLLACIVQESNSMGSNICWPTLKSTQELTNSSSNQFLKMR